MSDILSKINSSKDVKKLNISELNALSEEIRRFMVDNVAKTGGHLAPSLGTVELTLALHRVFNPEQDKIVWDVGHQSYTHKIITGRRDSFHTLRQKGGISGFPKTSESITDAFDTGHSSTSVSAALGFAKAFELDKSPNRAVAVIGDGALTGGMAYEALNHAGSGKTPLIVVLNDNGMSISQNVGGLSNYLDKMRVDERYINLKKNVKSILSNMHLFGDSFRSLAHKSKRFLKNILLRKKLFENMGLEYLGPVDGHDIKDIITVLEYAKSLNRPVIIHLITQKGKGYAPSENDPSAFHGISAFDPDTGLAKCPSCISYSEAFGNKVVEMADKNDKIICITAAMPQGTGLDKFAEKFPDRFFDVGIAEQHAVTFAAAMAKSGYIPIFAVYSTFLQRGYDQILHDTALQKLHTVFAIDRAGAVGSDGETHQGIYDFSYLSHMPNMTILAPACKEELDAMLDFAVNNCTGPVAIRYPKGSSTDNNMTVPSILLGKGTILKSGTDVLIVSIGSSVQDSLKAAEILEADGISVSVMNARFLKPFDTELFEEASKKCRLVATVEDNIGLGGLGSLVAELYDGRILKFAHPDKPLTHASTTEQKKMSSIDAASIAEQIKNTLKEKKYIRRL